MTMNELIGWTPPRAPMEQIQSLTMVRDLVVIVTSGAVYIARKDHRGDGGVIVSQEVCL